MIPKNLHFVWLGGKLPQEEKTNILSWKKYNPDLNIMIWTDDNINELNISEQAIEAINLGKGIYAYQADIIRYHAVNQFGGFYSDTDIKCYRKLENSLFNYDTVCLKPHDKSNWLTNAFFGSSPNSSFLSHLISLIKPTSKEHVHKMKCYIYGPVFFTKVLVKLSNNYNCSVLDIKYKNTKILDNDFWSNKNKNKFCRHYFKASWLDRKKL
jgi:mannosyltransferase OCH1-like enzyme